MGNLLFSPNGRIGQSTYWRAVIILLGISIAINVLSAFLPLVVGMLLGLLSLVFLWCWIAVHVKRLHDNGKTGWLVIAIIVAAAIVYFILGAIFGPLLGGSSAQLEAEMTEAIQSGDMSAVSDMAKSAQRAQLLPSIVTGVLMTALIGFGMSMLKTEPTDNQYGPVPAE